MVPFRDPKDISDTLNNTLKDEQRNHSFSFKLYVALLSIMKKFI